MPGPSQIFIQKTCHLPEFVAVDLTEFVAVDLIGICALCSSLVLSIHL